MGVIGLIFDFVRAFVFARKALVAENLALRQQLAMLRVSVKRLKLRKRERRLWVWLSGLWSGWRPGRGSSNRRRSSICPAAGT